MFSVGPLCPSIEQPVVWSQPPRASGSRGRGKVPSWSPQRASPPVGAIVEAISWIHGMGTYDLWE